MMTFELAYIIEIAPTLLQATLITLYATGAGMAVALTVGLFIAIGRRICPRPVVLLLDTFVFVVRSTPILIQLYLAFYVLPLYGPAFSPLATGILTLGIHYSTYVSEVYRAGIESVRKGQWEAAVALQFTTVHTWRRIVIPQAIWPIIPQLGNYLIQMYKHAALLATITVIELLGAALNEAAETFRYFEVFTMIGIIYFVIGYTCSVGVRRLEEHVRR